jgi:putative transposase
MLSLGVIAMDTKPHELLEFIGKYVTDNEEGMKSLVEWFLNTVMREEADLQCGCKPYERAEERLLHRNGIKPRSLTTRLGVLHLDKPQFREDAFQTCVFDRYARVEQAVLNMVVESCLQGVSTRRIREVVKHLGVDDLSRSSVSRIAGELDEKVRQFLGRSLELPVHIMYVDATYFKARCMERYVNKALFIVAGVRSDGLLEVLGAKIAECEDEGLWHEYFEELKERGLRDVRMVASDGHRGIKTAVENCFSGASRQMCQAHFVRAVLKKLPRSMQKEAGERLRSLREDPRGMSLYAEELDDKGFTGAAKTVERFQLDLFNYMSFPTVFWRRIRTTNLLESTNKELKRRSRVVGAFPNDQSLLRLAVTILMDKNEEWMTGDKFLNLEKNTIDQDTGLAEITEN